jgi:thymidine phosphorylase
VRASESGFVARLGAMDIGRAALHLGAGRAAAGDTIDHSVGIVLRRKRGDLVEAEETLAEIHAADDAAAARAADEVLAAYTIAETAPPSRSIVFETIV